MNGEACCILGVCCPPGSAAQRKALAKELASGANIDADAAARVADLILDHFDLAPQDSLRAFKAEIVRHAQAAAKN
jgi:hypothetical protein